MIAPTAIRRFGWALAALTALPVAAAPSLPLSSGAPAAFTLQGGSFTTSYYIDVPANIAQGTQLRLQLSGTGAADADLFLRYGTPFADRSLHGANADFDLFRRYAHYASISGTSTESIVVRASSQQPLRPGRWHVAVVNLSQPSTQLSLTATLQSAATDGGIQLEFPTATSGTCSGAPWNDSTPATPTGGNPGTTLGQQRRNAMQRAAELLAAQIKTPAPIRIRACWRDLESSATRAVLAQAGPTNLTLHDVDQPAPWLPNRYSWYAIAAASRLAGTGACGVVGGACTQPDIVATFNSRIGASDVLGGRTFDYGYTPAGTGTNFDFISITMHEIAHGLGFLGLVNIDAADGPLGARFSGEGATGYSGTGYNDVYGENTAILNANAASWKPFLDAGTSDAERAAALVSGNGLRWWGPAAVASPLNNLGAQPPPFNLPMLYAPCTGSPCAPQGGSTLSHLVQAGDLMNASYQVPGPRTLGLAKPMLDAVGWSDANAAAPAFAQPMSSWWFDRNHSGHGLDLQLARRDANLGDVYNVIFYTFDAAGRPEIYISTGNLVDGVFVGGRDQNGNGMQRMRYDAATRTSVLDGSVGGDLIIDFNGAASAPACRSVAHAAPQLGVMSWRVGTSRGQWCIEPLVTPDSHPTPDLSGQWYGGNDSGWGIGTQMVRRNGAAPFSTNLIYYPADASGTLRWGAADFENYVPGATTTVYSVAGYCRTCTPVPTTFTAIGSLSLTLTEATVGGQPTGVNRTSFTLNFPGAGYTFSRTNAPITLLTLPAGGQ